MSNYQLIVRIAFVGDNESVTVVVTEEESGPIPLCIGAVPGATTLDAKNGVIDAIESFVSASTTEEFRVIWKRRGWQKDQYRLFQRRQDAESHMEKLLGDELNGLAPLTRLTLQVRPVKGWRTCTIPKHLMAAYAKNVRPPE